MSQVKIAVLDDYQEASKPHFDKLRSAGYDVVTFTDTLLPYNHPDTPQDAKDALAKRLEPFTIICTLDSNIRSCCFSVLLAHDRYS